MGGKERLADLAARIEEELLGKDLLAAGIADIGEDGPGGRVKLTYPYAAATPGLAAAERLSDLARDAGLPEPRIDVHFDIKARTAQGGVEALPGVRNVIAVSSAKGGVGKSVVAANLALALRAEGARVGLLDADIHGPSLAVMLGGGRASVSEGGMLLPHDLAGIQAISMAHLVAEGEAVVWRGPMVIKALEQLLRGTAWADLDYLVLDLPPGTGDVPLSIAQKTPVTGALIVTTPHRLAIADAVRGIGMFRKMSITVLGYVANMSTFRCPSCGESHALFGEGAAAELEREHGVGMLAELPLDPALGAGAEDGMPLMASSPDGEAGLMLRRLANRVGASLCGKSVDRSAAFGRIASG